MHCRCTMVHELPQQPHRLKSGRVFTEILTAGVICNILILMIIVIYVVQFKLFLRCFVYSAQLVSIWNFSSTVSIWNFQSLAKNPCLSYRLFLKHNKLDFSITTRSGFFSSFSITPLHLFLFWPSLTYHYTFSHQPPYNSYLFPLSFLASVTVQGTWWQPSAIGIPLPSLLLTILPSFHSAEPIFYVGFHCWHRFKELPCWNDHITC